MNMRKWHRWIGLPAGIFLLLTAFTGVWLECVRFFGEEEALREKIRDLSSKHTPKTPAFAIEEKLSAARAAHWARKAALSRTLVDERKGGPNPFGVFYIVHNF